MDAAKGATVPVPVPAISSSAAFFNAPRRDYPLALATESRVLASSSGPNDASIDELLWVAQLDALGKAFVPASGACAGSSPLMTTHRRMTQRIGEMC